MTVTSTALQSDCPYPMTVTLLTYQPAKYRCYIQISYSYATLRLLSPYGEY